MSLTPLSLEDVSIISRQVKSICGDLKIYEHQNGHFSDRRKTDVNRYTACKGSELETGESVLSLHTTNPKTMDEFKLDLVRLSPFKVDLAFEIGDASRENIEILKQILEGLVDRVTHQAYKKRNGITHPMNTSTWEGYYLYRGLVGEDTRYYKNYEEVVRQNLTSPYFSQSLKDWCLHFRDY